MPTTTVKTIKAAGGSDYTTIQAWDDAAPLLLTVTDEVWEGRCEGPFTGVGTLVTIGGSTTDATRFKRLTCIPTGSFRDHASKETNPLRWSNTVGASISAGDNYGAGLECNENNFEIIGLQVQGGGTNHPAARFTGTGNKAFNCIFQGPNTVSGANDNFLMEWCLVIKTTSGGAGIALSSSFNLYNCTIVKPSDVGTVAVGIQASYLNAACLIKNCAVFGFTADLAITSAGGNTVTVTTSLTDDASPSTGFSTTTYNTTLYENITLATMDYRPKAGSALIAAGTLDAGHVSRGDIIGHSVPQGAACDVGCWESLVSSGRVAGHLVSAGVLTTLVNGGLAA